MVFQEEKKCVLFACAEIIGVTKFMSVKTCSEGLTTTTPYAYYNTK